MSGAGAVDHAFARETSFLGSLADDDGDTNTDYWEPFKNPTVQDLTLQRALQRQRFPDQVWADQSVAGNLEGAFAIEGTLDDARIGKVHEAIFNSASPYTLSAGLAQSSRWFIGLDYVSGGSIATVERVLKGCIPLEYTVTYTQGGSVRIALVFAYADETKNASFTPSSIKEANGTSGRWHGVDLDLGTTTQTKEQTIELSLTNMSRFERGSQFLPVDAVVGAAQASLTFTGIVAREQSLELAYGGSGQSAPSKTMSDVAGTLTVSTGGTAAATYNLAKLKPDNYAWTELFNADESVMEDVVFQVTGDPAVDVT